MPRPRGGDWLEDELRSLRLEGVEVLVSLLTETDARELELDLEAELCRTSGIDYISFPIRDRGVPETGAATSDLVQQLVQVIAEGKGIAIHCRAGIGRAAIIAACVLTALGLDVETAFQRLCSARGCPVPDTPEQRAWVDKFARSIAGVRT